MISARVLSTSPPKVLQAKIGLGSGGLFGVGIGQSRQSDLFLPESYGDFIFSVLGEQFGFLGTVLVLSLFFALFIIGVIISKLAKDEYGQLLGFAISFNIIMSAFINAGVVTGLLPTTGITLPFISFGGTSIILFCASVGILMNIAHQTKKRSENSDEHRVETRLSVFDLLTNRDRRIRYGPHAP